MIRGWLTRARASEAPASTGSHLSRRSFLGALAGLLAAPSLIEKLKPVPALRPFPGAQAESLYGDGRYFTAQGIRFYTSRKVPTGWVFAQKNAAGDIIGLHMSSGTLLELKGRK